MTVPTPVSPALYRHKPNPVEAMRFDEPNRDAVYAWLDQTGVRYSVAADGIIRLAGHRYSQPLLLGDWAVRDVDDTIGAVRHGVFVRSFDPLGPGADTAGGADDPLARLDAAAEELEAADAAWRAAIHVASAAGAKTVAIARAGRTNASVVRQVLHGG